MNATTTDDLAAEVNDAVIDLGAGTNPDPRADYTADLYASSDFQVDLRDSWPWPDESLQGIVARHVFEHFPHSTLRALVFPEAARVLQPGGWLEVRTPLGSDARTDPTHQSHWEWRTPDHYGDNDRHWQLDFGLELEEKRLHVWMIQPLEVFTPFVRFGAKHWPHEAWYELPGATGELIARYRRVSE